jgi:hypothetical protein
MAERRYRVGRDHLSTAHQTQDGTLAVTVYDNMGQPLSDVTVTMMNDSGLRDGVTGANGQYRTPLQPGVYTIVATLTGFGAVTRPGIAVRLAQTTSLDLTMTPAAAPPDPPVTHPVPQIVYPGDVIKAEHFNALLALASRQVDSVLGLTLAEAEESLAQQRVRSRHILDGSTGKPIEPEARRDPRTPRRIVISQAPADDGVDLVLGAAELRA